MSGKLGGGRQVQTFIMGAILRRNCSSFFAKRGFRCSRDMILRWAWVVCGNNVFGRFSGLGVFYVD